MKSCAQYIAEAKAALGDPRMTDSRFGGCLVPPYSQQAIAAAKSRGMSDGIALAVGKVLQDNKLIEHAGEVVLVAHAERDSDPKVRKALRDYLGKIMATASVLGLTVAMLFQPAPNVQTASGGEGR